jgi:hypothetical protein
MVKLLFMPIGIYGIFQTLTFCSHKYRVLKVQNEGEQCVTRNCQRPQRRFARKANQGRIQSTIALTKRYDHHRSVNKDQSQGPPGSKGPNPGGLKRGKEEEIHHLERPNSRQGHKDLQHHIPRSSKRHLYDHQSIDPKEVDGFNEQSFKTPFKSVGGSHA